MVIIKFWLMIDIRKTCENMVRCNLGNNLYSKVYESIELFNKTFADKYASVP